MSGQFKDGEYSDQTRDAQHGERSGLDIVQLFQHSVLHEERSIEGNDGQEVENVENALQKLLLIRTRYQPEINTKYRLRLHSFNSLCVVPVEKFHRQFSFHNKPFNDFYTQRINPFRYQ